NLKPGGNNGGWVDTGGMITFDRYAEQLWLTLFAKAPELTRFDFLQLQRPLTASMRGPWQDQETSFDFDAAVAPYLNPDGSIPESLTIAPGIGYTLEKVDRILGELGNPVGVKSYKPFHSKGEDFLHNFIGMTGIPIDLHPVFPEDAQTVLLTESAKYDPDIVQKIERHLRSGKSVVITSGLLEALQDRGLGNVVELEVTGRKAL